MIRLTGQKILRRSEVNFNAEVTGFSRLTLRAGNITDFARSQYHALPRTAMIRVLAFALLASVSSKTYDRCELAKELKYAYEVPDSEVGTWVCIAEHESQYNTSAIGMVNGDGSSDHGIFQINDEFWCSPPGKGWACGLTCAELEDDNIEDDFNCAKRIFKEHKTLSGDGFNAWAVYKPYCKGQRAQKYVEGCFNETDEVPHPKKKVQAKKVYPWLVSKLSSTTLPPEKTDGDLSKSFIGRSDFDENERTKAVSSDFSTVAPPHDESVKTVLPTGSAFTSSLPLLNSITSVSQSTASGQTLSRFSNSIPATDEHFPSSGPFNNIKFTSTSTTHPSSSGFPRFTNEGTTPSKLDSSHQYINSLTTISETISNRQIGISPARNSLPPSPILPSAKPATATTTIFPGAREATPLVPLRTVIGPNSKFTSTPERITLTGSTATSTSNQRIPPERVEEEPRFIVNGMAWV